MIQDIYPHILKNEYHPGLKPADDDLIFYFSQGKLLISLKDDLLSFPAYKEVKTGKDELIYLFAIDDKNFFLQRKTDTIPEGYQYASLSDIRSADPNPREYVYAAYTAYHLNDWYTSNIYCGVCSAKLEPDDKERALRCPACGKVIYPRINPAVIVGVISKDRLLLTRYRSGYGGNALVAGFTEIGETLEETVKREVREETGLEVENIRYYKSQPWGIAQDILAGFYCDVKGSDEIRMDDNELRYASFVEREEIGLQETDYSLTNEMMKRFKEGKKC